MAARETFPQARFVPKADLRSVLHQLGASLSEMARARATRRMLTEMDDRMLADIGIGRGDAQTEAARAPWDLGERRL